MPGTTGSRATSPADRVWRYPSEIRDDPACAYDDADHGELRAAITAQLERLIIAAYCPRIWLRGTTIATTS